MSETIGQNAGGYRDRLDYSAEIFPRDAVVGFNEVCRRERSLAIQNLKFQATTLGVFEEPKLFTRLSEDGKAQHTIVSTVGYPDGRDDREVSVAVMSRYTHPDPDFFWLEMYAMSGYQFDLSHGVMTWFPETRAYYDRIGNTWPHTIGQFGPYIQYKEGMVEVGGWHPDALEGSEDRWTHRETGATHRVASILGQFTVEDAVPFILMPHATMR